MDWKTDYAASLENCKGRYPNGSETVLAEGQPEARMPDDIEGELAVSAGVSQLMRWGGAVRECRKG